MDGCLLHPEFRKLSRRVLNSDKQLDIVDYTIDEKKSAILGELPLVLAECSAAYPFPWLTATTTFTGGTTAATADYRFEGDNQNAWQILTVFYDTDERMLEFYDQSDVDRLLTAVGVPTQVVAWTNKGNENGFPLITLIDTPDESAIQIKYRFWRTPKSMTFEEWPEDWIFVLKSRLMARFFPGLTPISENDMATMINAHNKGGTKVRRVIMDSEVMQRNIERNAMYRPGGRY